MKTPFKKPIENLIEEYLQDKALAMSPSTLKSEKSRLNRISHAIDGDPHKLYTALKGLNYGKYTTSTIWTRVSSFWDWANKKEHYVVPGNPYREFRSEHARIFKSAYVRKPCRVTFDDILEKINQISIKDHREKAIQLLYTGMRYAESNEVLEGKITGKGGKVRTLYGKEVEPLEGKVGYYGLYRSLRKVGLKPHDLRKAFASHLVRQGLNPYNLAAVMGWSSILTSLSYVDAYGEDELKKIVRASLPKMKKKRKKKNE